MTNNSNVSTVNGQRGFQVGNFNQEDVQVGINNLFVPAAKDPDWVAYSAGQVLSFGAEEVEGNEEEVYINSQIYHSYNIGSDIVPHVHWVPPSDEVTKVVRWALEYEWVNIGGSFSGTTTIYLDAPTNNDSDTHLMPSFAPITGTGKTESAFLICRFYRNSSHANDTYTDSAYLIGFDFHIQQN